MVGGSSVLKSYGCVAVVAVDAVDTVVKVCPI